MSYNYKKTRPISSNTRDFGGSYYNSSNLSNRSFGSATSNSIPRTYEPSYTSKYTPSKSYSRPNAEITSKPNYGISGNYKTNDYNFEYKPIIRKSMRDPSNSPSIKYSSSRYNETSPYSTYSSRPGSNSYLSDKDSSRYIPSSISSRESMSFISPSTSYSINNRESVQKEIESKEPVSIPKQSSFISKYKRNCQEDSPEPITDIRVNNQENEPKYDMISRTSRGTCTSINSIDDEKECSLISRTRIRKYPKQNVRIEMGTTVLVGNLSQIGKDISTQTSDDIFLPSPRIRQLSYRSGSSKGSISTSSYYSRGIDTSKYSRPLRSSYRQHSTESPQNSIPKIDENTFFDNHPKSSSKEKQLSPKTSVLRKSTPISIKDSIEKVNEWQIQNQILETESNSNKSPVPRSPNYHDLHAVTKPHYRRRSTVTDVTINNDKEEVSDSIFKNKDNGNISTDLKENRDMYVTQYTDLDLLLQDQFIINESSQKQNIPSKIDSYNSSFEESPVISNDSTLIFSSKLSKDIFNSMTIELQHIILKSKRRKVKFIDILDVCRNINHMKKFSDEEERSFKGYKNVSEMLIDLGIDIDKLENSVLQLCKFKDNQTEYGPFLDFDLPIQEQIDDLDGYLESGDNGVILRTKLSVRVEALIEKISNANGKELRRALFSLKQIFQDDKDLVQEFVVRNGLQCLRQIGLKSDQNHQNYILRALGQLMLYVDGMNGVLEDSETLEWLYSLLQGKFRLVVKLALKLLVVFIEYAKDQELHASVIISSINKYHHKTGGKPWSLAIKILSDEDSNDTELVTYAITFINKVLSSLPDQDTFYDVTDWLEEQGMEQLTKCILNKSNADVDMVKQFKIYETALRIEDGEGLLSVNNEGIRNLPRAKSETKLDGPRKSKRIQVNNEPKQESYPNKKLIIEDQRKKIDKQKILSKNNESESSDVDESNTNDNCKLGHKNPVKPEIRILPDSQAPSPRLISPVSNHIFPNHSPNDEDEVFKGENNKGNMDISKQTVKAMKNQFSSKSKLNNDLPKQHMVPTGDISGKISLAKDSLQNPKSKAIESRLPELKKDLANIVVFSDSPDWEELERECCKEKMTYKEWDFSDLIVSDDYIDAKENEKPPSLNEIPLPPPPPPPSFGGVPIPPAPCLPKPPPVPTHMRNETAKSVGSGFSKQKRTTRLHWRVFATPLSISNSNCTIWSKLKPMTFDTEKIESLFENKPHDLKKKHETGPKKLEVLDVKRSNAINIGMKNLVSIDCMKNAILNMTASVINREGVEKLLRTMLPTLEEIENIKAAQLTNKDAQLGQAEKFLLDLHEINLLEPRLEVWLFQLDFDQIERDILESLMDLKLGIKEIYISDTLVHVLSTLLQLGNFLNESNINAFSLEYLEKVPEVKDTKHKHSLLYHIVTLVVSQHKHSTDLHSDLSALNRCHRVDWDELLRKLEKLEKDCKKAWTHLKLIFKSDQSLPENIKKLKEFFNGASRRIVKMKIIHRRVMKRYDEVLQYLGFPLREAKDLNVRHFCKIMSDFAIEYRTTRERFLQLSEKKEKDRQRKKTRGAMIADINSLDRYQKERSQNENNDLLNVIMSRTNLANSDCDSDFNSLNNRRARRLSNQPSSEKNSKGAFQRPSSSHQMHNQESGSNISNMTPASSELTLDQSDHLLDQLAQQATSTTGKRRTTRRLAGTRERKSMRRTKPNITEDIIKCLDELKLSSN